MSRVQRELDELREKGLAKDRVHKLKDMVSAPLTTPEEAQAFLATMRGKSRRDSFSNSQHHPPPHLSADGMASWYLQQRQREKELRKRRKEAEALLRGYRMDMSHVAKRDDHDNMISPRATPSVASSVSCAMSEALEDPSSSVVDDHDGSGVGKLMHGWEKEGDPKDNQIGRRYGRKNIPVSPLNDTNSFRGGSPVGLLKESDSLDATSPRSGVNGIAASPSHDSLSSRESRRTPNRPLPGSFSPNGRKSLPSSPPFTGSPVEEKKESDSFHAKRSMMEHEAEETVWRDFISSEPGAKFPPEFARYHLYASYACPGSHRALIVRSLKGLEDAISVTIVHPTWRITNRDDPEDKHRGWVFGDPDGESFSNTAGRGGPFPSAYSGNEPDPVLNAYSVRDLYEHAGDNAGKYTIPVLWDKKSNTIVNNESSDIAYMLNSCLNDFARYPDVDFYTEDDAEGMEKLNEVNEWLYPMMIHGVYRCGFAKTQHAYDKAITELTCAFDKADQVLRKQRYLTGDTLTDADIRLFVTLLRFDEVYAFYFRANTRLVAMTPSLLNFCRDIYQMEGVAKTCNMEQIKAHFFTSHAEWNKYSIIPRGLGFTDLLGQPHDRDMLSRES